MTVAAAGLALTAASAVMQYSASQKAADAQKEAAAREADIARRNAERQRMETAEEARRLKAQQEAAKGAARAKLAASGVTLDGSTGSFLEEMGEAMDADLAWLEKSGESQAQIIEMGGANAYLTGVSSASATASTGLASSASTLAGGVGTAYDRGLFG